MDSIQIVPKYIYLILSVHQCSIHEFSKLVHFVGFKYGTIDLNHNYHYHLPLEVGSTRNVDVWSLLLFFLAMIYDFFFLLVSLRCNIKYSHFWFKMFRLVQKKVKLFVGCTGNCIRPQCLHRHFQYLL